MSVEELWWLSLGVAAVVVAVVAILLGLVIAAARRIDGHAEDIWIVGKEIAGNTVSIWMLERANALLARAGESVQVIEATVGSMEETLAAMARRQPDGPGSD